MIHATEQTAFEKWRAQMEKIDAKIAASVRSPSGPAAPLGALGVARGSLPVSSAEALLSRWEKDVQDYNAYASRRMTASVRLRWEAEARGIAKCVAELRREMGLPIPRQPEENKADKPS